MRKVPEHRRHIADPFFIKPEHRALVHYWNASGKTIKQISDERGYSQKYIGRIIIDTIEKLRLERLKTPKKGFSSLETAHHSRRRMIGTK